MTKTMNISPSRLLLLAFALLLSFGNMTNAQSPEKTANEDERSYKFKMRAIDETTAIAGKNKIKLWGISSPGAIDASVKLRAQVALDNAIGNQNVECTVKTRSQSAYIAQCINHQDLDLGLFMLQSGYAIVDRAVIYGTVFETPYIQAEKTAQKNELGIWSRDKTPQSTNSNLMLTLGFVIFIIIIVAFIGLSVFVMRGFQKIIDAQNLHMDMSAKERELKAKEREIFANMLDAEIKANKSKIEAYIIVYDEVLNSLRDTDTPPKYQSVGDIVQKQPALSRVVFDRNTDKLDFLGNQLSSELIHFYARIKTNAEYENLEPETPLDEAIETVDKALKNARRLDKISDRLIDQFEEAGLSSSSI